MMFGYVRKRGEGDYIIGLNADGSGVGYNVVSRHIDPYNVYDIDELEQYLRDNPEMLLDFEAIEAEDAHKTEIASLKAYLSSTDYIYPKCLELGLDVNMEYADTVAQRIAARARIQELET